MNKFFCNNCNNTVTLVNGKCPKCGYEWKDSLKNISDKMDDNSFNERKDDIISTFDYFFYWGFCIKLFCLVVAIVFSVFSIFDISKSHGLSLLGLIPALVILLEGIAMEKRYKWKAYLLQTNY